MDLKGLEAAREELASLLVGEFSPRLKLFLLSDFIDELCCLNNKNIVESYLAEFIDEYIALLKIFEPSGLEPSKVKVTLHTLQTVIDINIFTDQNHQLSSLLKSLNYRIGELEGILNGNESAGDEHIYFPVVEHSGGLHDGNGLLDSVDVKISKNINSTKDNFYIIPTIEKIEKRLNDQIRNSWNVARRYVLAKFIKISEYHDIVIKFDKKYGEYIGNSLGLTLTFAFIEELLKYYQARELVRIKAGVALTGGITGDGTVINLTEDILSAKTETVFYSTASYFVVPKEGEKTAQLKSENLLKKYPGRNLKIFGVESIYDLMDRRTLIDIKSINPIIFLGKKLKKRKFTLALIFILLVSTGYFLAKDYDDNPYSLDFSNHIMKVKNKFGNTLWQTRVNYSDLFPLQEYNINRMARIVDVDKDGRNDVILANEQFDLLKNSKDFGRISCYNYEHKLLWKYTFRDSIRTKNEKFTPYYSLNILGINNDLPEPEILLVGQHENYYPSPLIKLRLRDGKRVGDIFWHSGGGSQGFIADIDGDGKDEVVADAISNGLESCVLYSIDYDKLKGTSPTTGNYTLLNMPVADFDHYLVLPKSDLNGYYKERYNYLEGPPFITYDSLLYVGLREAQLNNVNNPGITYEFDKKFNLVQIVIGDKFRVVRDTLVAEGKIKGPFTETKEYKKYLKDQIKYWNGKKFVQMYDSK